MKRKLSIAILFAVTAAFAAEKNYLNNGDFARLDSKKNLISWKVDAATSSVIKDGTKNVVKATSRLSYGKYSVSLRQTLRNMEEGAYTFTGEVKGDMKELLCVFSFPAEVQKRVTFTRGRMLLPKDGWTPFQISMIVPKKSAWVGSTLTFVTPGEGNKELQFRSFCIAKKKMPVLAIAPAAPKTANNTGTAAAQPRNRQAQFMLPDAIYAVPGIESNIYYKNIFLTLNYANYMFEVDCAVGRNDQDRWRFVPRKNEAGKKYPMTITVKDEDGVVAKGSTTVYVTPADAGKGKSISLLMVGDSLTDATMFSARVKKLFDDEKSVKLTMIGSRKDPKFPGVAHEGYGGWSWASFLVMTPGEGVKKPSKFMVRKDGGFAFDLNAFLKKYGDGKVPDFITFQLGVNDIFGATDANRKYKVAEVLENADRLLAEFRKFAPDAIIGVGFTTPSATSQDAFGIHYKCGQTMWGFNQNQFLLNQAMAVHFAEKMKKDKKLFMIPTQVNLDRDHNFPMMEEAINHGNSKKIIRQCNGRHPAAAGYDQMGDSVYMWLKYQLSKMK